MHPHLIDLLKRGDPDELCALMDHMDDSLRPLHYILCWLEEYRPSILSHYLDADRTDKTPLALPMKGGVGYVFTTNKHFNPTHDPSSL